MHIKHALAFFLLAGIELLNAASDSSQAPHILAVSGIDGFGSSSAYIAEALDISSGRIIQADIPRGWLIDGKDLGQSVCANRLMPAIPKSGDIIVHASSQGAGTVLNTIGKMSRADQSRIKTIIVEGAMVSGNSAIMTGLDRYYVGFLRYLPFAEYIAPYLIKVRFPRYWPAGDQAIKSIDTISRDVPVIIIHSIDDPIVPYPDACALYYGLCAQGRENVYFLTLPGRRHVSLLGSRESRELVQKILTQHRVVFQERSRALLLTEAERLALQPPFAEYKALYECLRARERNHVRFSWMLFLAALCGAYYIKGKVMRSPAAVKCEQS